MNTQTIITQVKRELWENKTGFFYAPLIVTGLIIVLIFGAAIGIGQLVDENGFRSDATHIEKPSDGDIDMGDGKSFNIHHFDLHKAALENPFFFGAPIEAAMIFNSVLLAVVLSIVLLVYAHNCLFDDRKNRDILFWRSMPVGEVTNVFVKLGVIIGMAPVIVFFLNIVVGVVAGVVGTVFFVAHGVSLLAVLKSAANVETLMMAFKIFGVFLSTLLLLAPVAAFFLFCSSLAKKSPMFTSTLIPFLLIVLDKILQTTLGINLHIMDTISIYLRSVVIFVRLFMPYEVSIVSATAGFACLVSLIVGSVFLYGAVWLRNNRYEI